MTHQTVRTLALSTLLGFFSLQPGSSTGNGAERAGYPDYMLERGSCALVLPEAATPGAAPVDKHYSFALNRTVFAPDVWQAESLEWVPDDGSATVWIQDATVELVGPADPVLTPVATTYEPGERFQLLNPSPAWLGDALTPAYVFKWLRRTSTVEARLTLKTSDFGVDAQGRPVREAVRPAACEHYIRRLAFAQDDAHERAALDALRDALGDGSVTDLAAAIDAVVGADAAAKQRELLYLTKLRQSIEAASLGGAAVAASGNFYAELAAYDQVAARGIAALSGR